MSHMQIDFPSPSPLRSKGYKRPRSPASPSPLDRPSKRVSLPPGPNGRTHSPLLEHITQQEQQTFPNVNIQPLSLLHERRVSPEDWVSKTNGLKLESPLFGFEHARTVPLPGSGKWSCADSTDVSEMSDAHELISTDADDGPPVAMDPWLIPPIADQPVTPQPHTNRTSFSSPLPLGLSSHPLCSSVQPPDIHIQPATPSEPRPHHSTMTQSSPMSISPSRSGIWSSSPSTKKARVTMGPRPDCERCRLGVKGHWMHIE